MSKASLVKIFQTSKRVQGASSYVHNAFHDYKSDKGRARSLISGRLGTGLGSDIKWPDVVGGRMLYISYREDKQGRTRDLSLLLVPEYAAPAVVYHQLAPIGHSHRQSP